MLGRSVPVESRAVELSALGLRHLRAVRRMHRIVPNDPVLSAEYRRAEDALRNGRRR